MNILLFPGQGAQFKGMGKALFEKFPDLTDQASTILGYDIRELCLEDPEKKLSLTPYTQPALYTVNALAWYDIKEEQADGFPPQFALGHSLGEYNALLAADVFDFQTGLRLVKERGRLMGEVKGGGMAAVMAVSPVQIQDLLARNHIEDMDLANFNTPTQTVISGPLEALDKAVKVLTSAKARVIQLNVSAPFHSRYMAPSSEAFAGFLENFTFRDSQFPVIANATARPYPSGEASDLLARQISSPVKWVESIRYLMALNSNLTFNEVNAAILSRMVVDIRKNCTPLPASKFEASEVKPSVSMGTESVGQGAAAPEPVTSESMGYEPGATESVVLESASTGRRLVGNPGFCKRYGLRHPYVAGAMSRGIGSREMAAAMARAGMIGYLGTAGLHLDRIEADIQWLQKEVHNLPWGLNLLHNYMVPQLEEDTVDLYLRYGIRYVEASAYIEISPALVRYRLAGLKRDAQGSVFSTHHVLGKCSRPEVATQFLSPAPERVVKKLLDKGRVTPEQAEMAKEVPMASEICVEADSAGHTDMGIPTVLFPAMQQIKERLICQYNYRDPVYMGLGGGIGTPQSALVAFVMGADFILTGSINQCTVEAGSAKVVKEMLQKINVQDTAYAPAGEMFEMGAKVQVLRRGVFFPARANKLYQLYTQFDSLDEIPEKMAQQIQNRYFRRSFDDIWNERRTYLKSRGREAEIVRAEANPKHKMAAVFRWYFDWSTRLAITGDRDNIVDFQVHTGPSLGAFNQWVKGTDLEFWQNRHVDRIALKLLDETEVLLREKIASFI